MSEAIASVPHEAAPPLVPAPAPDDLEARRALNAEYLRRHPDEVALFLDERMPSETALIVHDAGPESAAAAGDGYSVHLARAVGSAG